MVPLTHSSALAGEACVAEDALFEQLPFTGGFALTVDALILLEELNLYNCKSLTSLPSLDALVSLQTLDLRACSSLAALPNVSGLPNLKTLVYIDVEDEM